MIIADVVRKSETRLVGLHPLLRYMAARLVTESFIAGVPIIITQGYRSIEYQNQLFSQGRKLVGGEWQVVDKSKIVTKAKGGRSFHNYGLAVDFALLLPDGRTASWDTRRDGDSDGHKDWFEVADIGKRIFQPPHGEWGGDWDRFCDMPHFQYSFGITIDQLEHGMKAKMTAEIANTIITSQLQPAWKAAKDKGDEEGMARAAKQADELRIASGQKTQNG